MTFPNKVNTREENPQNSPVESHEDLWKDIIIGDGNASPRRRPREVLQYSKLDVFEEHGLVGRKIQLKKKQLLQATLPVFRLEERHAEEIQTLKVKNKRARERGAWLQFLPDKSFLEQKQRELGPLLMGGMFSSLLDRRKTQALELSAEGHHLNSGPRAHRGDLQPLAPDDNNKEATRKLSKKEKRKLRMEWWDPTVWGGPVTLAEREQSPRKTCSEFQSNPKKLSFPIGRSYYRNLGFVPQEH
uniref:DUF4515 domain-containing protein n=1 Tax=Peromyscus maniculatus bairdii TaxID=230844 RepID=A0A8C8UER5_PERMB